LGLDCNFDFIKNKKNKIMKKLLLIGMMFCIVAVYAQHDRNGFKAMSKKAPKENISIPDNYTPLEKNKKAPLLKPNDPNKEMMAVSTIPIGQSGNAFGFAFMRSTYLWADNNIKSISFMHRMINPPGTGYLAMDLSKDGGINWDNNIQAYNSELPDAYNARYPQGGLFNPPGNTDPDNAYFHYFAPTLDGSNSGGGNDWGGYAYGVKQLSDASVPTQTNRTSEAPYKQYLPPGFTITQTGEA
jgi:hypothetical protein